MLTQPQVRRYSEQSRLRDMMIAEKEIVLTFLLQLLSERQILARMAFKGRHMPAENVHWKPGAVFDRSGFHGP